MKHALGFLLVLFFINFNLYGQDDFFLEYNNTLDSYEEKIEDQRIEIAKNRAKINQLLQTSWINDNKLKEAIQRWEFANLKIEEQEKKMEQMSSEYQILDKENKFLKLRIDEKINELKEISETTESYKKELENKIADKNKKELYATAIDKAYTDFESGKKKTTRYRFENNDLLFIFNTGFKTDGFFSNMRIDGPSFSITSGFTVNQDNSIFVGLGGNYHYNKSIGQALYGLFIASKICLTDGELIDRYLSIYTIVDLGYSFPSIKDAEIQGGFFTNIGLGVPVYFTSDVSMELALSWRRLNENGCSGESCIKKTQNTLDVSLGIIIVI